MVTRSIVSSASLFAVAGGVEHSTLPLGSSSRLPTRQFVNEQNGAIVARSSQKCLDIPGGNAEDGQTLWTWDCYGGAAQKWAWETNGALVWDGGQVWTKCVDVPGDDLTNGNLLELWECNGLPQQQWGYDWDMGTLYLASSAGDASKCLDLQNGGQDNGTPVQLWDCLGGFDQEWDIYLQSSDTAVI